MNVLNLDDMTEVEAWMEGLGSHFTAAFFVTPTGVVAGRQVDDPVTIQTTVKMEAERLNAKAAVYRIDGEWEFARYSDLTFRRYPNREGALMAARTLG